VAVSGRRDQEASFLTVIVWREEAAWQHGHTMPSDRDWPRDPRYDDAALERFEERLRRARPGSRPGYLRAKGATLLDHRDPAATLVAIHLLHRATESGHCLEVPWAHELLGKAYRKMGDLDAAEHHYRHCMATADEHGNGTTKSPNSSSPRCYSRGTTQETSPKSRSCCRRLT
jgi:hypothetical protein